MKTWNWVVLGVVVSAAAIACSSSDTTTSGSGGAATGGSAGSATGGSAGSATGGSAGSATGGSGGGTPFWTDTYNPSGTPNPASGQHKAGQNCKSCHTSGSRNWVFAGTIYGSNGTTGQAHVQVGVKDKNGLYTAYSGANGNFWLAPGPTIDWATAEARARDANGETVMAVGNGIAAGCNSCHSTTSNGRLIAP